MSGRKDNLIWLRFALVALCFVLPSLTLIPLGGLWLWEKGYALYWVAGAFAFVGLAFLFQLAMFRRLDIPLRAPRDVELPEDAAADTWTPRENQAWDAVLEVADTVKVNDLTSWPAFWALGKRTIDAVARKLHPEQENPLWEFTAPEALTIIEQVAVRLKPVVADNIPLGDKLTIGQVIRIYEYRSLIDVAQKGYDIWRIIRMLNPAAAVTQELRERMSNQMYRWGREELAKRLARAYVKEVGRAAIDLYGGRLRVEPEDLQAHVTEATERDRRAASKVEAEPLRLLIGGQVNAGKSSLVNALLAEIRAGSDVLPLTNGFTAYELKREGVPQALLLDSPGLDSPDQPLQALVEEAANADLILWVASAVRPDRDLDARALEAIRAHFAERPNRRRPPMLFVLSHVDRLRPARKWSPPYDLDDASNPKAASIRGAVEAADADLGFAAEDTIPACLDTGVGLYNVDAIWAAITEKMPEAQRAQLVRTLQDIDKGFDWRKLRTQAANAGRIIAKAVFSGGERRP
ncbi:50S ribosome-binding GTPase [Rhodomicrobium vannielii ATCC 17100]|uniref:GTPase family protein n=1 Tax=Rhodomicrobium vannielii TaxID=1069 RepID=UPI00191A13AC|nr:GTPase [Rhodomicrobium vannielii]MBJ7534613.1 50S ribosome-binding GTPase [Rhodomicrobium vannielii ATCC 17100]